MQFIFFINLIIIEFRMLGIILLYNFIKESKYLEIRVNYGAAVNK